MCAESEAIEEMSASTVSDNILPFDPAALVPDAGQRAPLTFALAAKTPRYALSRGPLVPSDPCDVDHLAKLGEREQISVLSEVTVEGGRRARRRAGELDAAPFSERAGLWRVRILLRTGERGQRSIIQAIPLDNPRESVQWKACDHYHHLMAFDGYVIIYTLSKPQILRLVGEPQSFELCSLDTSVCFVDPVSDPPTLIVLRQVGWTRTFSVQRCQNLRLELSVDPTDSPTGVYDVMFETAVEIPEFDFSPYHFSDEGPRYVDSRGRLWLQTSKKSVIILAPDFTRLHAFAFGNTLLTDPFTMTCQHGGVVVRLRDTGVPVQIELAEDPVG